MNAVDAVAQAKQYVTELFGEDAGSPPRLEEVVPMNDEFWDVTLSFKRATPLAAGMLAINMSPELANYQKVVRITKETGDLVLVQDVDRAA
jgi:hypothetical protein